jgi:spoIIIJ-associated protein
MKDAIFVGRDVAEALELAARNLGLAPGALRYLVLEPGRPAGPGHSGSPARIAVLLDSGRVGRVAGPAGPVPGAREPGNPPPPRRERQREPGPPPAPGRDPYEALPALAACLGTAAGAEVQLELRDEPERLLARLGGPGAALFLADGGEALEALDHLLQRSFGRQLAPRRLRLECEGYRERRDARLTELARELAAAVRRDGRPRSTGALNAYERRLIHLALGEDPELRTFSVGLGSERRVTIARKDDAGV